MAELVSSAYAEALFEVALEMDKMDEIRAEFGFVIDQFKAYPEFLTLYRSPQVHGLEKKDILKQVFSANLSVELMNFLNILIDKTRTDHVERIFEAYCADVDRFKKESTALVKSVILLTELQKEQLSAKLNEMTGKKITIANVLDPELIGGVTIKIGDQILDGSLQRKLSDLKESLRQVVI
jgi:F-type H+-transporting ATPase subunit delta